MIQFYLKIHFLKREKQERFLGIKLNERWQWECILLLDKGAENFVYQQPFACSCIVEKELS